MARLHVSQRAFRVAGQCISIAGEWGMDVTDVSLTVSDVARHQGVSRATAWRVLEWMVDEGYMVSVSHPYKNTIMKFYQPLPDAPMPTIGV